MGLASGYGVLGLGLEVQDSWIGVGFTGSLFGLGVTDWGWCFRVGVRSSGSGLGVWELVFGLGIGVQVGVWVRIRGSGRGLG